MAIETIEFKGEKYPRFQQSHFASRFIQPFALEVCTGVGLDIGCGKDEWKLKGSIGIDETKSDGYNAMNLPPFMLDFVFSSHCLEHIPDWAAALMYWTERLKEGGVMFLYLPDHSQKYWRCQFNRKHVNSFTTEIIKQWFIDSERYTNIYCSGIDLNNSFAIMATKIK